MAKYGARFAGTYVVPVILRIILAGCSVGLGSLIAWPITFFWPSLPFWPVAIAAAILLIA